VFAQKIYKGLAERPLAGMEGKRLSMVFGAAGIPEDCTDVNNLLAAAEFALNHARAHGKPFATYSELLV
jgi:predicted signal transduction protein with EAL and GGDEF domain